MASLYGQPIPDPDAVLFDATGAFSGVPDSVLVGGRVNIQLGRGQIAAVRPDLAVAPVFGPTANFFNLGEMMLDSTGRLVFTDIGSEGTAQVLVSTGGAPVALFSSTSNSFNGLAIGPDDTIYTTGAGPDGTIRVHSADGTLINDSFATGFSTHTLAFGTGGAFGTDLYAGRTDGTIARIAPDGTVTEFGSGFAFPGDLAFGPDGLLYVGSADDRVYVVAPVPEPATGLLALCAVAVGGMRWRRQRRTSRHTSPAPRSALVELARFGNRTSR